MLTGGRRGAVAVTIAASLWLAASAPCASAATSGDLRTAAVALAHEAQDLLALKAFPDTDQRNALEAGLSGLGLTAPSGRSAQLTKLKADDRAGAAALSKLGSNVAREVRTALAPLTAAQLSSITRGGTMKDQSSDPGPGLYLAALEALVQRQGAAAAPGSRPDPQQVNTGLAQALGITPTGQGPPPSGQPTTQPGPAASPSGSPSRLPWVLAGLAALGVLGFVVLRRPSRRSAPAVPVPTGPPVPVHSVLDASRRLTTLSGDEMPRAIVREAQSLVPAMAAALIQRDRDELVIAHESQPGLLRQEGFSQGVVDSAANAGRVLAQMVNNDPSFARQPVQVLLLPLVSAGRVDAVVILIRDAMQTFTPAERDVLATFAPIAAAARESAAKTQAAVDASQIDPLTGAGNRRQLDTHLPQVLRDAGGESTGFFMIDLDHFKSVNDTYGHPAGDAMLRQVCTTIREAVRPTDGVYRYGGEEFCVLLPTTTLEETQDIAERVRAAIEAGSYDVGTGKPLPATASVGVACTAGTDGAALIAQADRALYAAKTGGRNQVRSG